ncbi:MAG: acyl-CoA dehydrogenase family protein [Novosphingobium sp.]|nr:acyl-CoA dehydrogenase family protein [Novosphingobium sp.]
MNLDPTDDQQMMLDAFTRFLDEESSIARVRAALPSGFDAELWSGLGELGALGLRVAEDRGGLGLGLFDAVLLMEQAGRTLVSGPLAESLVANSLLADLGGQGDLLDAAIAGSAVVTIAMHDVAEQPVQLVVGGAAAGAVIARRGDEVVLVRRTPNAEPEKTLASTPIDRVDLAAGDVSVLASGEEATARFAAALEEWKLLIGSALNGLSREAIRLASEYACERVQFGKPIGAYQGVSHPLADAIVAVDAGRLMIWRAVSDIAREPDQAGETVAMAAWWAGNAAEQAVMHALHTFGGYGLTLEYDVHLFNLRSRAWLLVMGDPEALLDQAADRRYAGARASLPEPGEVSINFSLAPEELGLAQETRTFFETQVTPDEMSKAHYSYSGYVPSVNKKMAEAGILFPEWPEHMGGRNASPYAMEAAMRVWEEFNWTAHPRGTSNIIGMMIDKFGTETVKNEVLARIISGESICSLGYSEPGSGSDVFAARTRAVKEGNAWRIDGQKMFTSGAEHADYAILLTRTDPDAPKHKGITMFMVPLKVPEVTVQEVKTFQDERTNITYYDGLKVPDEWRLGEVNGGLQVLALALEIEQGMSFAPYQHRMIHAAEEVCKVLTRDGRPLIEHASARRRLTRAAANTLASDCLRKRILYVGAENKPNFAYGPASKLFSAEAYRKDSFDLLNLIAPESLAFENRHAAFVNQCFRHSQVAVTYGGTSEVQRSQIAEKTLGLPRTR